VRRSLVAVTPSGFSRTKGEIITFYSYKGGTGRSMALANVGYILASDRARAPRGVLMIDWDLEAPGLHRYFSAPAAPKRGGDESECGLIEFLESANSAYGGWEAEAREREQLDADPYRVLRSTIFERLGQHIASTDVENLYLMRAGSLEDTY